MRLDSGVCRLLRHLVKTEAWERRNSFLEKRSLKVNSQKGLFGTRVTAKAAKDLFRNSPVRVSGFNAVLA
jgi:hypothetical protein